MMIIIIIIVIVMVVVILLVIIIILLRLPHMIIIVILIIILVIVILLIIIVLRLPYDPEIGRKLLSPPELLKRQPVFSHRNQNHGNFPIQNLQFCLFNYLFQFLPVVRMPGELSDHEEEEVEEVGKIMHK